jgi:branched-chain amino acid aminotransferase
MTNPRFLSFNGEIVPYRDAKVHVLTPGLKYGTGVFEGLRAYWNDRLGELHIFRLREHLDRLQYSMKVMRYEHQLTNEVIERALLDLVRANELREDLHIRLLVWVDGDGEIQSEGPIGWMIAALPRPLNERVHSGINVCVSPWQRIADNSMPARVKSTSNYVNGRLAGMQAKLDGYDNVLFLTQQGHVSESAAACFFMARKGQLITPSVTSSILESITRATVMELAAELTQQTSLERDVDRTEIYAADEAFLCGTAQEIVPILTLDRIPIGTGQPGPLTRRLQAAYFALVRGEADNHPDWLTPVWSVQRQR